MNSFIEIPQQIGKEIARHVFDERVTDGRTDGQRDGHPKKHNAVIQAQRTFTNMLYTGIHAVLGMANINIFDCSPHQLYDEVHHCARAYP